jgi:hypothetical protein
VNINHEDKTITARQSAILPTVFAISSSDIPDVLPAKMRPRKRASHARTMPNAHPKILIGGHTLSKTKKHTPAASTMHKQRTGINFRLNLLFEDRLRSSIKRPSLANGGCWLRRSGSLLCMVSLSLQQCYRWFLHYPGPRTSSQPVFGPFPPGFPRRRMKCPVTNKADGICDVQQLHRRRQETDDRQKKSEKCCNARK